MAPVTATTTGLPNHPMDDPGLVSLLGKLRSYDNINDLQSQEGQDRELPPCSTVDIEGLVGELETLHEWRYTEQVRLDKMTFRFYLCRLSVFSIDSHLPVDYLD